MDTTALLQAIYKAYREKRLPAVLDHLDEGFQFVVHLPEDALPGADRPRNKEETAELLQSFMDTYDFLAYDHGPIIVVQDRATVQPQIRYRDKKSGKVIETKLAHAWRVKDGKATELEERHDVARIQTFLKSLSEDGK